MTRALSAPAFRWAAVTLAAIALAALTPRAGHAAEGDEDELDKLLDKEVENLGTPGVTDPAAERQRTFPWVEQHGYFRFRADFFHNGHLGTVIPGNRASGTSGIPAPLTENEFNNSDGDISSQVGTEDAQVIAYANIRLRYSPKLHISEDMRVGLTLDILDNLVLGSTPDFAGNLSRPDVPLSAFSQSQTSPSAGINGFSDAIRVKEAYGEWQPAFLLRVGRQASHWGLGILANGGQGVDSDYGDYTDRALLLLKVWEIYVVAAWDYVYSGAITDDPTLPFGQPKDLGGADDVNQYVVSLFQRPLTEKDRDERRVQLYERFQPAFDWGLYGVFRTQELDLDASSFQQIRDQGGNASADQLGLVTRNAFAVIPDLWLRFEQRFDFLTGIRLELEAVAIIGEVENVNAETGAAESPRDLMQWGVAFEGEFQYDKLSVGIDGGVASGDDAEGFGILDRNTLAEPDGSPNSTISNFKFDRDYHVDLILFREVIGAVTNAWYVKPWVAYDLFDAPDEKLGFRLDLLTAGALEPEATPGNVGFYGFEADLRLFFHNSSGLMLDLETGFFFPGAAFNYRPVDAVDRRDASFAFTLQTRLTMAF